jgi:putative endonuclease
MNKQDLGKAGEEIIVQYLQKKGWTILETNFRYHKKEIDIIARKGDIISFIEVKTRRHIGFGMGMEAVDELKQRTIIQVARYYMKKHYLPETLVRFDVASVDGAVVSYIEDAFRC